MRHKVSKMVVLLLIVSMVMPVKAANENKEVPVTLNSEASQFSVTVPTALPISVDANGLVSTATDTKIINNSSGPVQVNKVEAQGINGWTLVDYNSDFIAEKLGTKKLGLQINGDTTNQAGTLNFTQDNWPTIKGLQELGLTYNAVLAPQKEAINESIANVIFTLGWDNTEENPDIQYTDFHVTSSSLSMIGYTGSEDEDLVIPATFIGDDGTNYRVTSIGDSAFFDCKLLKSVTIPCSVTLINDCAFVSCYSLTQVNIPDSVTEIGEFVFAYCTSLTSVTVPDSVTTIGADAFINIPLVIYGGTATGSPWGAEEVKVQK